MLLPTLVLSVSIRGLGWAGTSSANSHVLWVRLAPSLVVLAGVSGWLAAASASALAASHCDFMLQRCLFSLNLMNQPVPASDCSLLTSLSRHRPEEIQGLAPAGLGIGWRECGGWFYLLCRPGRLSPLPQEGCLLVVCGVTGGSTLNFPQELALCIHNLARLGLQHAFLTELKSFPAFDLKWETHDFFHLDT